MSNQNTGIVLLVLVCCAWPVLFHLAALWVSKQIAAGTIRLPWRKQQ